MNAIRGFLLLLARACIPALVGVAMLGHAAPSWGQGVCNPPCGPNQLCVQNTCMVPAPPPAYPAPPVAYPPPPGGYQQTAPPPAGYVPQQANPYPPPSGNVYAPPPQGYPPANNYAPQPAYAPPPPPSGLAQRRGFLAMPFLGINSYVGSTGNNIGAGLRLGVLMGGHINEMFSANGEFTIDVVNYNNLPPGTSVGAADVVLAFSPLAHFPFGNAEFAVGPKLGFRSMAATSSSPALGGDTTATATGFVFGVNAGIFAAVSDSVSLGGLLMAELRSVHQYCETPPGGTEACSTAIASTGDADKVIGLAGAALF